MNKKILLALLGFSGVCSQVLAGGAGGLSGQFSVSPSGAAVYSVPLSLPAGINNIQPNLNVTYNSQSGDGPLGQGGSLSGLSAITRCGQSRAIDGQITAVNGSTSDRLCLDGQELIAISGGYWGPNATYRTQIQNFSTIQTETDSATNTLYYQVTTKSGSVMLYGSTSNSRQLPTTDAYTTLPFTVPISWYIDTVYQQARPTNKITYKYHIYTAGDFGIQSSAQDPYGFLLTGYPNMLLQSISYAYSSTQPAVTVGMNYVPSLLADRNTKYAYGGLKSQPDFMLQSISVCDTTSNSLCGISYTTNSAISFPKEQGTIISTYQFTYVDVANSSASVAAGGNQSTVPTNYKLETITACGLNNQCLSPVKFNYQPVNLKLTNHTVNLPGLAVGDKIMHGDFNGDGMADLLTTAVVTMPQTAPTNNYPPFPSTGLIRPFLSNGTNLIAGSPISRPTYPIITSVIKPSFSTSSTTYYSENLNGMIPFDFNGSGRLGLIMSCCQYTYPTNSTNMTTVSAPKFDVYNNSDPTGNTVAFQVQTYPSSGSYPPANWLDPAVSPGSTEQATSGGYGGDVNGSGIPDLIRVSNLHMNYFLGGSSSINTVTDAQRLGASVSLAGLKDQNGTAVDLTNTSKYLVDMNGDGISDIVAVSFERTLIYTIFMTKNQTVDHVVSFSFAGYAPSSNDFALIGDFNGDGFPDIATYIDGAQHSFRILYSKGNGQYLGSSFSASNASQLDSAHTWAEDWNGDGRADIVIWDQTNHTFTVMLSTGNVTQAGNPFWYYQQTGITPFALSTGLILPDNYTGDGRTGILGIDETTNPSTPVGYLWTNMGTNGELQQIDTYNGSIQVAFTRLTDKTTYTKQTNATFPQQDIQNGMQVVKSFQTSNGAGGYSEPMQFYYSGLKTDLNLGSLGFSSMKSKVVNDPARSSSGAQWSKEILTTYRQDFPYIGMVDNTKAYACDYTLSSPVCFNTSLSQNTWGGLTTTYSGVNSPTFSTYFPFLTKTHTENYRFNQMYQGGSSGNAGWLENPPPAPTVQPGSSGTVNSNAINVLPAIISILLQ